MEKILKLKVPRNPRIVYLGLIPGEVIDIEIENIYHGKIDFFSFWTKVAEMDRDRKKE